MSTNCIVGYCPELYDALQMVAHQELPYEPMDEWPPHARQYNDDHRRVLIEKLIKALGDEDDSDLDRELEHYLSIIINAIDDSVLKELILLGSVKRLLVDDHGYYLVEQR